MKLVLIAVFGTCLSHFYNRDSPIPLKRTLEYIFYNQSKSVNIIFIHGSFGTAETLFSLASHYKIKNQANSYLISMPNHGNSYDDPNFSAKSISRDIRNFILDHNLKNVYLVGHSLGALVAEYFASQYPGLIKGIAAFDFLPFKPDPSFPVFVKSLVAEMMKFDLKQTRAKIAEEFVKIFPDPPSAELITATLEGSEGNYSWSTNLQNYYNNADGLFAAGVPKNPFYGKFKFVTGTKSPLYNPALIPRLPEYYPRINLQKDVTVFQDGYHTFFIRFFEETVNVILDLIK